MGNFETFLKMCERSVSQGAKEARTTKLRPKKSEQTREVLWDVKRWTRVIQPIIDREVPAAFRRHGLSVHNERVVRAFQSAVMDAWDRRLDSIADAVDTAARIVARSNY